MMSKQYAPIFNKDGDQFLFLGEDWCADNEHDAWKIGIGGLVECVLLQATFSGKTLKFEIDDNGYATMPYPVETGKLGVMNVVILRPDAEMAT